MSNTKSKNSIYAPAVFKMDSSNILTLICREILDKPEIIKELIANYKDLSNPESPKYNSAFTLLKYDFNRLFRSYIEESRLYGNTPNITIGRMTIPIHWTCKDDSQTKKFPIVIKMSIVDEDFEQAYDIDLSIVHFEESFKQLKCSAFEEPIDLRFAVFNVSVLGTSYALYVSLDKNDNINIITCLDRNISLFLNLKAPNIFQEGMISAVERFNTIDKYWKFVNQLVGLPKYNLVGNINGKDKDFNDIQNLYDFDRIRTSWVVDDFTKKFGMVNALTKLHKQTDETSKNVVKSLNRFELTFYQNGEMLTLLDIYKYVFCFMDRHRNTFQYGNGHLGAESSALFSMLMTYNTVYHAVGTHLLKPLEDIYLLKESFSIDDKLKLQLAFSITAKPDAESIKYEFRFVKRFYIVNPDGTYKDLNTEVKTFTLDHSDFLNHLRKGTLELANPNVDIIFTMDETIYEGDTEVSYFVHNKDREFTDLVNYFIKWMTEYNHIEVFYSGDCNLSKRDLMDKQSQYVSSGIDGDDVSFFGNDQVTISDHSFMKIKI